MIVDKSEVQKLLRVIQGFDPQACAFVGVQLEETIQLIRSSPFGFVQTKDFELSKPHVFAALNNFRDLLTVSSDRMNLTLDKAGKLRLDSDEENPTKLQVHTVRPEASGYKHHFLGVEDHFKYPSSLFEGFDIRVFRNLTFPPLLQGGRLMLNTLGGVVIWTGGPDLVKVVTQPRESFLRFVASGVEGDLKVSNQGYWIAERGGLRCAFTSHRSPNDVVSVYAVGAKELVQFNAARLLSSLDNVGNLSSDTDRVDIHPKEGVTCRDRFSNAQIFPHGATGEVWPPLSITGRTAKLLAEVLRQSKEENAVLSSVPLKNPTYRLVRGSFEVNFGLA